MTFIYILIVQIMDFLTNTWGKYHLKDKFNREHYLSNYDL